MSDDLARPSLRSLLEPDGLRDPHAVYGRWRAWEAANEQHPSLVLSHQHITEVFVDPQMSAARIGNIVASAPDDLQVIRPGRGDAQLDHRVRRST